MRKPTRRPVALNLELLEDRRCPVIALAVVGTTVIINSDNNADFVQVNFNTTGQLASVKVDVNKNGNFDDVGDTLFNTFAATAGDTVIFNGRGGDDVIEYRAQDIRDNGQAFVANLGKGNDVCAITLNNAGAALNLPTGMSVRMRVDGGKGNDFIDFTGTLTILVPPVDGALQLELNGGHGDEQISATVLGTQQGGQAFPSVVARLSGGTGQDEMQLEIRGNRFGELDADARSKIIATVDGDSGDDRLTALLTPTDDAGAVLVQANARKARGARTVDGGEGFDRVTTIGFRVVNHEKGK